MPAVDAQHSLRAGRAAAAIVEAQPRFARARRIALFAALGDEIASQPLFELAVRTGRECVFPRCLDGGELDFARVLDWGALRVGARGALEPPGEASAVRLAGCDLAFLPGVAFDRWGGRLGRGAGYYDRALSKPRAELPFLCGLSYAFQVVDRVPMGPRDIRVDAVASETAWFEARREPGELRE